MPQLKQLSCCVQWADTNASFQEYGTAYGDGVVETFIVVPNKPQRFCVRLTSRGYVHEGLAMIVFIDGQYQCNRSRVNLLPPKKDRPTNRTEVDFLVRQKEKPQGDGVYLGREWRFDNHNIVAEAPDGFQESHFDDLGTIEVLVLRCRGVLANEIEYEGSSSGEDSDMFGDHPTRDDEAAQAEGEPAETAKAEEAAAQDEEDSMGGMFGLFDGASDAKPFNLDGGADSEGQGQWVWHQRAPPPGLDQARRDSYQSAHQPYYPQYPHIPHPPVVPSPYNSQKRVHFDYGPSGYVQPPHRIPSYPADWDRQPSARPHSRERMRSGERQPPDYPRPPAGGPYPPQQINTKSYDRGRQPQQQRGNNGNWQQNNSGPSARGNDNSAWDNNAQSTNQSGRRWGYGDGTSNQNGPNPSPRQQAGHQSHNYSPQRSPHDQRSSYGYQHTMPHLNQPSYSHAAYQHAIPEPSVPQIPPPAAYHGSPRPQLPQYGSTGYPPGYGMHPAYMQMYYPGYHAQYPYPGMPVASPGHPPPELPISPKNTSFNAPPGQSPQGGQDSAQANDGWGQQGSGGKNATSWNDQGSGQNGNAGQSGSWGDKNANDAQNGTNDNWDGNQDSNQNGGNDNSAKNQGNNDNTDNSAWPNDNGADKTANNDNWGGNNNATANNGDQSWGNQDANNNISSGGWDASNTNDTTSAPPANAKYLTGNSIRELYGPHGPYYSYRASRMDEPKPDAEEEPRYDVPKELAFRRKSTKQVQPGPGYRYYKRRLVPEYIDSFDTPYARFVFKYRTKEQLLNEIGIVVDVEPSSDQEVRSLQDMDKQALIEMLIRAKGALGGKVPSPPATPSTPASGSEVSLPVAVDAPKYNYLKYSLPPSRPSILKKNSPAGSVASSNKENNAAQASQDWGATTGGGNNGGDSWGNQSQQSGGNGSNQDSWQAGSRGSAQDGQSKPSGIPKPPTPPPPPPAPGWDAHINRPAASNDNWGANDNSGVDNSGWGPPPSAEPAAGW